jgi:hypothetical protein
MKFDNILAKYKGVLNEAEIETATQQPIPQQSAGQAPVPQAPVPQVTAPVPPPKFMDKPYADIGQLLYKALKFDFNKLSDEQKSVVNDLAKLGPKSIDTDEKGMSMFQAVERITSDLVPSTGTL